jgi:hypothetical protein
MLVCGIGYYCQGGTSNEWCGTGSTTSSTGSDNELDCYCSPGYFGNNGQNQCTGMLITTLLIMKNILQDR